MVFGGLQKSSLIDYPGKVSCVLFLSGCNFDCPFCHNPDLVNECKESAAATYFKNDGFYTFLEERKNFLDGVVISGGEPTLQDDLVVLCERIKSLGYPIKLDTNGSRPKELKQLINNNLVDYIAMDIKTDPVNYHPLIKKKCNIEDLFQSIQIIMESASDYEFRTTCVKGLVDEQTVENIARLIQGAKLYALQSFNKKDVLHPDFFKEMDSGYSEEDLDDLKTIADPWVKKCIVR